MKNSQDTIREVREMLEKALQDREAFAHINGEAAGVLLPEMLAGNPNVTLKLSYYYRGALVVGEEKVEADLLFPEGPFTCVVPIQHIWGITQSSGESMFWPEHAPKAVLEEMVRGVASDEHDTKAQDSKAPEPKLKAVPIPEHSSMNDQETDSKEHPPKPKGKKPSASLKRIK